MNAEGAANCWVTRDGQVLRISDMEDGHLHNTIALFLKELRIMKASRIVSAVALIALIGGPGAVLSQAMAMEPKAAIQAERMPTPPDVRDRLTEVGRRLQEARLASYSRPLPQGEYIEAQHEIARGEYQDAMNHLNQVDQELDDVTYSTGR